MAQYKFVDHWTIVAPIEDVYNHIADPRTYAKWWSAFKKIEIIKDVPFPYVGGRARMRVKSPFGYSLALEVETTGARPPYELHTVSYGSLAGTGDWVFEEKDGITYATWTWIVESHHPLLNRLEWLAKPLFAQSHVIVSERGHQGLKRLLEPLYRPASAEQSAI
jgi:uncharacterized protein YndB with AHSA1/START domain